MVSPINWQGSHEFLVISEAYEAGWPRRATWTPRPDNPTLDDFKIANQNYFYSPRLLDTPPILFNVSGNSLLVLQLVSQVVAFLI
jgi:hypothetical protein